MIVLGISCYYHDSAACIVQDGVVLAAALQERFTRIKHDNSFPIHAIEFCLNWLHLKSTDIDLVVFYEKPIIKFERVISHFIDGFPHTYAPFAQNIGFWFWEKLRLKHILKKRLGYTGLLEFIPHHLSHAASSFYLSEFNETVVVTFDGVGEWATTTVGLGKSSQIRIDKEIRFPHSLGLFYSALTAYLGFAVNNDEYKVMGLAAYGDPKPFAGQFAKLISIYSDGSFSLNLEYFTFLHEEKMYGYKFEQLLGMKTRRPESRMTHNYENIAAAGQKKLEEVVFHLLNSVYKEYKIKNLCLSGGVALNSVMNGKILSLTKFKNIYIPPDPGDGGGAMGAALWAWQSHNLNKSVSKSFTPFIGPGFSQEQIEDALKLFNLTYKKYAREDLLDIVSDLIIKERIIGWFQGRMEWGPRALGNRSILASARSEKMKDIINSKVKHRELFRPFAPVVLVEHVSDYFETDQPIPASAKYMLMVYPFKEKGKVDVPATVHVDGTGRLQVVERKDNPLYYDLISEYYKKTGVPIIINTSFNVRGEPIVCAPQDAIKCFLGTEIDYLVIGNCIVKK